MKYVLFTISAICMLYAASGQTYYYYSSTEYTYAPYYFDQTLNFVGRILEEKKQAKAKEEMKQTMAQKTKEIKEYYESIGIYPERIKDGWHEVVIIAGNEFIDDRKVYVQNNKIQKSVRNNWREEELSLSGPIVNGKTGIKLKDGRAPLDGLILAFFINSIADSSSEATPPLKPGQVTFWTSSKKKNIYLFFEDASFGPFKDYHKAQSAPGCGNANEINIIYKPGVYKYKGVKRMGYNIWLGDYDYKTLCEGTVEIKEDGCALIRIDKKRALKK